MEMDAYISSAERISGCKHPGPYCIICGSGQSRLGKSPSGEGSGAGKQPGEAFLSDCQGYLGSTD